MKRQVLTIMSMIMVLAFPGQATAMSKRVQPDLTVHPSISAVKGDVKVKGAKYNVWEPAGKRMLVLAGDTIMTGKNSRATLVFRSGTIELYSSSAIRIPSIGIMEREKDLQEVYLQAGKAKFKINPLGAERQFSFKTEHTVGTVRGTMFIVKADELKTKVVVYRGTVDVSDPERSTGSVKVLESGHYTVMDGQSEDPLVASFDAESTIRLMNSLSEPDISDQALESGPSDRGLERGVRDGGAGGGQGKGKGNNK